METITISNRFFSHELNNYSNWRQAFWREFIQNSVDAKARTISIQVEHQGDTGKTLVRITDNGCGMDEDTLRNIYFQLGNTSKDNTDSIGGHGRARILTCFAHDRYSIRTQNLLCNGEGGRFEIENNHPFQEGCIVEVQISASHTEDLHNNLVSYLETCQLPCAVEINGQPFTRWLYRRQASRTIAFGTLHVTKKESHRLYARVRGVTMFTRYLDCEVGVILEIDPIQARNILPVSRDNLKYEEANILEKLTSEIAIDHQSIKRDCLENRTEIFGNLKPFKKKAPKSKGGEGTPEPQAEPHSGTPKEHSENRENHDSTTRLAQGTQTTWHGGTPNLENLAAAQVAPNTPGSIQVHGVRGLQGNPELTGFQSQPAYPLQPFQPSLPTHMEGVSNGRMDFLPEIPEEAPLPELALHFEDAPKPLIAAAKRFDRKEITGTRLKMLRAWEAAVEFFLERVYPRRMSDDEILYMVGFLFSTNNEAMHVPQPGNGHLLLINPLNPQGKLAFSVHDYEKLFAIALHECTHVLCRAHCELYAGLQTELTQECLKDYPDFKLRIQAGVAQAQAEIEERKKTTLQKA